jgi:putative membrane protein
MKFHLPLMIGSALILSAPLALAQTSSMQPQNNASGMQTGGPGLSKQDTTYLKRDARGAAYELDISRLAAQKAQKAQVRQYAEMIVNQHEQANQHLHEVAQANGVAVPTRPDHKDRRRMAKLQKLNGAAFDKTYLQYVKQANEQDLKQEAKEIDSTKNPQVRQFVQEEQQLDQQHAKAAQALQANGAGKA